MEKVFFFIFVFCFVEISYPQSFFNDTQALRISVDNDLLLGSISDFKVDANGNIYLADSDALKIYKLSDRGQLSATCGREGRGPGEYRYLNSMTIHNDELHVLDYLNARIIQFSLSDCSHIKTVNLDISISMVARFFADEKGWTINFKHAENDFFMHRFNFDGKYVSSFGSFIDFEKFMMYETGKMQLIQTSSQKLNGHSIHVLSAPYRIFMFDSQDELLWSHEDSVLPKPWEEYIIATPERLRIKYYPMIGKIAANDDYLIVYWLDIKGEEFIPMIDLRDINTGELLVREKLDEGLILVSLASSADNSIFRLMMNGDTGDYFIFKSEINY